MTVVLTFRVFPQDESCKPDMVRFLRMTVVSDMVLLSLFPQNDDRRPDLFCLLSQDDGGRKAGGPLPTRHIPTKVGKEEEGQNFTIMSRLVFLFVSFLITVRRAMYTNLILLRTLCLLYLS